MANQKLVAESKSAERLAFEHYLRTGRRLSPDHWRRNLESKFNPYHDPRNGRFTFAPGGPRSLRHVIISDRRGLHGKRQHIPDIPPVADTRAEPEPAVYRPGKDSAAAQPAQYRPNPRARAGGNGGPPLNDPITLERTFPSLANSPTASIVAIADNILDLTGPANRLTTGLAEDHVSLLIRQNKTIDPNFHPDMLGFPTTLEGQINLIRQLRLDRAEAFYRVKNEIRPLQVETLRIMQERADSAYVKGQALYESGHLKPRLSRQEAIGNYIDRMVKMVLRKRFNTLNIDYSKGQPVRVVGREYDTSGNETTYRIPDARVGNVAFDVTLTRKTLAYAQVRGFFKSDFKPDVVIIIRPSQLGPKSTYAITSPGK